MILVDASVFVDHFRAPDAQLAVLLEADDVLVHPWVLGELALGHLGKRRSSILRDLAILPAAPVVAPDEVLQMIDAWRLAGSGLGYVDAQLLASACVSDSKLFTHDKALARAALRVGRALAAPR